MADSMSISMKKKEMRKSNMELLRIVAMFLVLVVHADFFSLGTPTQELCKSSPVFAWTQFFVQSIAVVCVNVFVLLSGWFSIRPKWKSFLGFMFQCFFFSIGIYFVCLCIGISELSLKGVSSCFFLTEFYWFIVAYIGLYLFAPMVNAFIESVDRVTLRKFLVCFFVFQTLFAWCSNGATFLLSGTNTISFIGLYGLARYVRLYPSKYTTLPAIVYFSLFFLMALISGTTIYFLTSWGGDFLIGRFYTYVSPIVIVSSLLLLLAFSRLNVTSKLINWIASSCFAVYLLHANPNVVGYFCQVINKILRNREGVMVLVDLFVFLFAIFVISVLVDKIRIMLWKWISGFVLRKHDNI